MNDVARPRRPGVDVVGESAVATDSTYPTRVMPRLSPRNPLSVLVRPHYIVQDFSRGLRTGPWILVNFRIQQVAPSAVVGDSPDDLDARSFWSCADPRS